MTQLSVWLCGVNWTCQHHGSAVGHRRDNATYGTDDKKILVLQTHILPTSVAASSSNNEMASNLFRLRVNVMKT